MAVEAEHHYGSTTSGDKNPISLAPSEILNSLPSFKENPKFFVDKVVNMENNLWTCEKRVFSGSVGQMESELEEVRDIWLRVDNGNANLGDSQITHHLAEEIGDGIIASIGIMRHVENGNTEKIADSIGKGTVKVQRERTIKESIARFQFKGQKLLGLVESSENDKSNNKPKKERKKIRKQFRGFVAVGLEVIDALDMDMGSVIVDKVRKNKFKYPHAMNKESDVTSYRNRWENKAIVVFTYGNSSGVINQMH